MICCLWGQGCVLAEENDTNRKWHRWLYVTRQGICNCTDLTKSCGQKKDERATPYEKDRKLPRGSILLKNTPVAHLCVFSENVAGGHFSISNPISSRDSVSVAADCWSPLDPCDGAREGAAEPYWPFIWTHRGYIASLWRNIQLITLESGLTGREQAVNCKGIVKG